MGVRSAGQPVKKFNTPVAGAEAVLAAASAWGMSGIFVTLVMDASDISAISLAFWRDLSACIVFSFITAVTGPQNFRLRRQDIFWVIGMGAGLGAFHIFFNQGIVLSGAAVTTVQQAAMPAFVAVAARYLWHETLTKEKLCCMGVIFLGTALASGLNLVDLGQTPVTGLAVGFIIPVFYAAWTLCGKQVVPFYGATASLAMAFGIASFMLLPFQPFVAQPFPLNAAFAWSFAGLIAISTVGGFFLYMTGLKHIQAGVAAILIMSEILFACIYAWFLLGERLGPVQLTGTAMVMAGVIFLTARHRV